MIKYFIDKEYNIVIQLYEDGKMEIYKYYGNVYSERWICSAYNKNRLVEVLSNRISNQFAITTGYRENVDEKEILKFINNYLGSSYKTISEYINSGIYEDKELIFKLVMAEKTVLDKIKGIYSVLEKDDIHDLILTEEFSVPLRTLSYYKRTYGDKDSIPPIWKDIVGESLNHLDFYASSKEVLEVLKNRIRKENEKTIRDFV